MIDDPNELMDRIQPFFPHDPALAIRMVSNLFPSLPMWISEMVVYEFFQALRAIALHKKHSPQYDDILSGKSRDLKLPMDLTQPLSLN